MHYIRCRRLYLRRYTATNPRFSKKHFPERTQRLCVTSHTHARTHPRTRLLGNQYTHTPNIHILLLRHVVLFGVGQSIYPHRPAVARNRWKPAENERHSGKVVGSGGASSVAGGAPQRPPPKSVYSLSGKIDRHRHRRRRENRAVCAIKFTAFPRPSSSPSSALDNRRAQRSPFHTEVFTDGRLPRVSYRSIRRRRWVSRLPQFSTPPPSSSSPTRRRFRVSTSILGSFIIVFFFLSLRDPMSLGRVQYTANATAQVRTVYTILMLILYSIQLVDLFYYQLVLLLLYDYLYIYFTRVAMHNMTDVGSPGLSIRGIQQTRE